VTPTMAWKREPQDKTRPTAEVSTTSNLRREGLSKEAWIAIGTVAAALITGAVTLLVHVLPSGDRNAGSPVASPAIGTTPAATPLGTANAIAGKWVGNAKDANGTTFQITLEVDQPCVLNERCGLISVSHVPCYGEIFLEKATASDFEFRVANFYGQSNRAKCQPGGGENFKLQPDGKLIYTTTYEPGTEGLLERK
jgi:hypothetical protein